MVDSVGYVNAVAGAPAYNGRMLRQLNAVGFAGATAARPLGARSGVRPGTPATTVTATSTTWTCQPFAGLLDGQSAAESGPYTFAFDAVATGAVAAASASIARVDIIYVQVDDPSESDGSTVPAVTRKYLAGTVASTAPATPARSIVIAHINVPISGGGSPTVTWKAPYCAAAGGVVDVNTKTELDLWTTANPEQRAKVLATGGLYVRRGSSWVVDTFPPTAYTPTLTGATLGNGTLSVDYSIDNGWCSVSGYFALGGTSSLTSDFNMSLPVTAHAKYDSVPASGVFSNGRAEVRSGTSYLGQVEVGGGKARVLVEGVGATYNSRTPLGAGVPFAWVENSSITFEYRYRIA